MQQKRTKILIFISFIFLVFTASSQNANLQKKITIIAKNKSLTFVLNEIQKKTDIKFSYNTQSINSDKKVTLIARKKTVNNILKNLFHDLNIEFIFVEKQIVLKKKFNIPKKKVIVKKKEDNIFTISGLVKDEFNGEVLIGAGISLQNLHLGTMTNEYGFYSLTLPKGKYILNFSSIGFASKKIEINLSSNIKISQNLKIDASEIEIIVITEDNNADVFEKTPLKQSKLTNQMIKSNIGLVGEADVIKSIQSIPRITSYGDGSVLFYVRGGEKDQNLIMIDDAPIYNPSHLFGFFSAISADAVNDMKIYKNNFPIKYGGRLSSLIDIKTKDGNLYKWGFSGKLSLFTASYTIDGPIKKERSTLLLNLRRSHINAYIKKENSEVGFFDFHIKFKQKINRNNHIFFSLYSGKDELKLVVPVLGSSAISWQNNAFSLRWNKLYTNKLFSNTTLYLSKYDYFLYYSVEKNKYWNSFIGNLSLKNDFTYFPNPKNKISFGISNSSHFFNPGNLNSVFFARPVYASDVLENVLYVGHDKKIHQKINVNYGLRLINWNNMGTSTVFYYDENYNVSDTTKYLKGIFNSYYNIEPQVSISYAFSKTALLKLSYDRHIQNLQLLSNSISPFTTLDVWMPSGVNIKPEKSHQFVAGFNKNFPELTFSSEVYYKNIKNLVYYAEHANMLLNPYIEGELRFGKGYSYGFEFMMQKQKGSFNFYAAYSYSRTFARVKDINYNKKFPVRHDKPHNVNLNISYHKGKRWEYSASWIFTSGMRFSSPTGFYNYSGYNVPIYSVKNNDKLPDYHRLDISAKLNLNVKEGARYKHYFTFSIFNLYGRNNLIAVNFNKIETKTGEFKVPGNLISEKEFVPTSLSLLGFMPSISYSFSFR